MRTASALELRLLGGFELRRGKAVTVNLDSTVARALLAYLASHRGRALERELVASLLWPEVDEGTARHNLRQALYSLRQTLSRLGGREELIEARRQTLQLVGPEALWVDVEAFSVAAARGLRGNGSVDPAQLAHATRLYRGELLAGLYLRESPSFESWLLAEQERLRELAASVLRRLVRHHLETGGFAVGMQYSRQLLRIDSFAEEAHRDLMQLYALSGRRSRALGHFRELRRSLRRDLGVDPSEETRALALQIEKEELAGPRAVEAAQPKGPVVPFLGRESAMAQLAAAWEAVQGGSGRLTLVEGPAGIGKTRLVRTFLDAATSSATATVLLGSGFEGEPAVPYRPLAEALGNAISTDPDVADQILLASGKQALQTLAPVVGELAALDPRLLAPRRPGPAGVSPAALASALAKVLASLCRRGDGGQGGRGVILFLDDLHAADPSTLDLVELLASALSDQPCWIVGTYRADKVPADFPWTRAGRPRVSSIGLEPLEQGSLAGVAEALLGAPEPAFAALLFRLSEGHPQRASELVNLLADEQLLARLSDGKWSLARGEGDLDRFAGWSLDELVRQRLNSLPSSARRMLSLASVVGQTFAPEMLQEVEGEQGPVVDIALKTLTDRWFVRPFPRYWADSRSERFEALAGEGARSALFEFTHPTLRSLVYQSLPAERLRFLHGKVAHALERQGEGGGEAPVEQLAHHFRLAGDQDRAEEYCSRAADRAERLGAKEIAMAYRGGAGSSARPGRRR